MKRILCILLALALCLCLCGCGGSSREVRTVTVLVEQDYSLAFRTGDPTAYYVVAAIEALNAEGKVDELSVKWFGTRLVSFGDDGEALGKLDPAEPRSFIIGVDTNSFPMAYLTNGQCWGFDIELATAVCERAWGGIALDPQEVADGKIAQYGPYVHNDIVIAKRGDAFIENKYMLANKALAMCSTQEAMDALQTDPGIVDRLGQISRLAGGTTECFQYLYQGRSDVILTDTTAIYYFNCH